MISPTPIFEDIEKMVCEHYGITSEEMRKPTKSHSVASEARTLTMGLCYGVNRFATYHHVGEYFNRHHATVIHSHKKAKDLSDVYPEVREIVDKVRDKYPITDPNLIKKPYTD